MTERSSASLDGRLLAVPSAQGILRRHRRRASTNVFAREAEPRPRLDEQRVARRGHSMGGSIYLSR